MNYSDLSEETQLFLNKTMDIYSIIKDKYEMTYFKRFIFRDKMVYQITIGGKTRLLDILKKEREIFFNSIYFPEDNPTPN